MKSTWSLFFTTLSLTILGSLAPICSATAQITPDSTLGNESSTVSPLNTNIDIINGGATRGSNLFHSFQEFNVGENRAAYFSNPNGITNILTRVTGGNPSNIQGILGVVDTNLNLSTANLFLINPNGINFGPNAQLVLGGSFFGSTASSIVFDNGVEFSAANPPASVLTVNIPVGLRFRDNPRDITTNRSVVGDSVFRSILQVQPGKTLALVGGNVSLDGGILFAPGGRIEVGGLSTAGTVGINPDGSLSFPDGVARGDVFFKNNAIAFVAGAGGGDIAVNTRNLDILGLSRLFAGIETNSGIADPKAGDITLNATGTIRLEEASLIRNNVYPNATGNAGNINVIANSLLVTGGGQLISSTFGKGDAGNITINADIVTFDANVNQGFPSAAFSTIEPGGEGKGGDISITARSLSLTNGGELNTFVREASTTAAGGIGDAGNVKLNISDTIKIAGVSNNGIRSGIFSNLGNGGTGKAGNIEIFTGSLFVTDGGQISSNTAGKGDAGNITINADTVSFDRTDNQGFASAAFSIIEAGGEGKGGDISITARLLSLTNGGNLNTFVREATTTATNGIGNAGNVKLNISDTIKIAGISDKLAPNDVFARSGIFSNLGGGAKGKAGNIDINAGSLLVTDGGLISSNTAGEGNAGNISIDTRESVLVTGGGQITSNTFAKGDAGNITINATDTVSFDGTDNQGFPSAVFSTIEPGGEGKAGDVNITAKSLSLTNGGELNTFVREGGSGIGNAGNVKLNISDQIKISGISDKPDPNDIFARSGIFSGVGSGATGKAGNIEIFTGSLFVTDGGQISSNTAGKGDAGNITIKATDTVSFDGTDKIFAFPSAAFTTVEAGGEGKGGDISITARSLSLTNGGQLNTFVREATDTDPGGVGDAGDVKLNISDTIQIAGISDKPQPNQIFNRAAIFSSVERGAKGNAGDIEIIAGSLFMSDGGLLFASTVGEGDAGKIKINARSLSLKNGAQISTNSDVENRQAGDIEITTTKDIRLDNRASITAQTRGGQGNIILRSRDLIMRRNSNISTNATGIATGGNIDITTGNLIALENSDISARAEESFGGRIIITADSIFGTQFREDFTPESDIIASSQLGPQFSGTVQINTPDVDPSRGLVELPETVVDPQDQIAQNPCQKLGGSEFIITGRGGLPPSPNESFSSDNVRVDLVQPAVTSSNVQSATINQPTISSTTNTQKVVPAQGWVFNKKGDIVLTAYDPAATNLPQRTSSKTTASCPAPF
ncbi:filamentous hemagglutinin N-terminal domain-containing protein [Chlorogloeopsis sp. ULAP01]|uniref:two-partner secretion domain-containing protein n=1 Tax=Chlorogloeopsis sp. ULAP01 TaxID=3056483 RepID=UPI0025AB48CF|nr:filamentous hemagglutinin N-terminal domain-containing protein [Chlorogloeopsis sp. ULAP01]MDM9381138.1 filamentous hemagglutinin N-terminal domain-containing protein [Chlorogloeopsis sp. ULAP01]